MLQVAETEPIILINDGAIYRNELNCRITTMLCKEMPFSKTNGGRHQGWEQGYWH